MAAPSLRVAATLAALLLGITGCSSGTGSSQPEPPSSPSPSASSGSPRTTATPAVVPPAPPQGACYQLSLEQLAKPTNASEPVPCARRHDTRTIYVGRLRTVFDGHALAVDSDAVRRQLATTCPRQLAAFVGGTPEERALSRFEVVWFSPTLRQSEKGADWFRCDLVAFGTGEALLRLPPRPGLKGALDRDGGLNRFGLCGTAEPGAPRFERVVCSRPHTWRAISTIPIAGRAYPGAAAARESGDDTCRSRVRQRVGFTLKLRYGWEWPTPAQWRTGQRYGFCWAPV